MNTSSSEMPMVEHLVELRSRLLRCVAAILIIFAGLFYFANDLYLLVSAPLQSHLKEGATMIATDPASPFFTPFKLTLVISFFLAMPYVLYQAWAFIAPGLYRNEKRFAFPLLFSSIILFYAGMAFAYFVVLPIFFGFINAIAPDEIAVMTDISSYLDFVLKIFFAFGLTFEIPIATILMVWAGLTTTDTLRSKRPYVIVGAFVIGMLLTPPDIFSQTLLAIPMWLLFEAGIIFSGMISKQKAQQEVTDEN